MYSFAKLYGKMYDRWEKSRVESNAVAMSPRPISKLYMSKTGEVKGG